MKRFLISLIIVLGIVFFYKDEIIIPKESIRVRVISNYDSMEDNEIKKEVKDVVEDDLYYLLKDISDIEKARDIINNNINLLENDIDNKLKELKINQTYSINYGYNYFPLKKYKGVTYDEGMYESLVVTLGEGLGDNWWCVMFPPFCLIEAHDNEKNEFEYKWFVKELINKYVK